jgi:hypothetical protein
LKPRFAGLAAGVLSLVLVVLSSHGWAGEGTVAAPANPALAAALESVHPEAIRADLYFIASDELAGRDTPSLGLRVAARFLRARLERLGLQPGGPNGSYFAPFALEKNALDIDACKIEFGGKTYELGKDYFLSAFGGVSARDLSAPIVYAGELKAEELEQIDASGKWLLVLERDSEMRLLGRLGEVAAKKPAGLIVVPAAGYVGKPYAERFASWMERLKEPRLAPVTSANKASEGSTRQRSRGSVNTVYLPAETKDALFAAAHVEEAQLKVGAQLALDFKEVRAVLPNPEHVDVENVCGFWPGNDPVLKNDVIMVTAHYDHVGVNKAGEIFNGADDNGSGTAACWRWRDAHQVRTDAPLGDDHVGGRRGEGAVGIRRVDAQPDASRKATRRSPTSTST